MGGGLFFNVNAALSKLFNDYSASCKRPSQSLSLSGQSIDACETASAKFGKSSSLLKARFKMHKVAL